MTETSLAASYERWRTSTLGRITERVETRVILDLLGPLQGKRVLDVGTGDGTYAIEAATRGGIVTAIDRDLSMLDAARERASKRTVGVSFQSGHAEQLPLANASFDVVCTITVLCLVEDPRSVAREMARVLAPGGRLVIGELARFSVWAAERRLRGWLGARRWRQAHFWSRSDLERLVIGAGLHVRQVRGSVFYPPSGIAARALAPLDPLLSRVHAPGAAFLAIAAEKAPCSS